MKCRFCNSEALRRSRLRRSDIARLLMIQYPIRCRRCHIRVYVWAHEAFKLKAAGKSRERGQGHPPAEDKGTASGTE
jgi:hypothetical protein